MSEQTANPDLPEQPELQESPRPAELPTPPAATEASVQTALSDPSAPGASSAPSDPSAQSAPSAQSSPSAPSAPSPDSGHGALLAPAATLSERTIRGILLSLVVIPVGVVAWVLLWNAGFIASIVSFGVAFAAVWLYRVGSSRARVTRLAFWSLIGVIAVTVFLSFLAGIFADVVTATGVTWNEALTNPAFWATYWDNIFNNPTMWNAYAPQLLLALAFAALGCFGTIRRLARESKA